MNVKVVFVIILLVALLVNHASSFWSRRRRRRRTTTPKPTLPPCPASSPSTPTSKPPSIPKRLSCRDMLKKFTKVNGNDLRLLASVWAPSVRLAKDEKWNPSSVEYFLRNVKLEKYGESCKLNPYNLPTCESDCYLTTRESLGKPESPKPDFLRGQDPDQVPVYVFITQEEDVVEFDYKFFYPYNLGKKACVGAKIGGKCIGKTERFGNHVGDWENVKIRFEDGELHSMYVSTHDSKITEKYLGTFLWNSKGRYFEKGSKKVYLEQCTHGVVYSSAGSHGFWHAVGTHVYEKLDNGDKLSDKCSVGQKWETWKNLKFANKLEDRSEYSGEFSFAKYEGRWGNKKKGCISVKLFDFEVCTLNRGPKLNL